MSTTPNPAVLSAAQGLVAPRELLGHDREKFPLRILVVDDDPLIRWALGEMLREQGFIAAVVADAASALMALSLPGSRYDLLLLDYRLPDATSFGALAEVRRVAPFTPVVMMSALYSPELAVAAHNAGAFCLLPKPFEFQRLVGVLLQAHRDARRR